eukprot:SAG31_NODE_2556_length_5495_cov_27.724055_2_plen_639_part_00
MLPPAVLPPAVLTNNHTPNTEVLAAAAAVYKAIRENRCCVPGCNLGKFHKAHIENKSDVRHTEWRNKNPVVVKALRALDQSEFDRGIIRPFTQRSPTWVAFSKILLTEAERQEKRQCTVVGSGAGVLPPSNDDTSSAPAAAAGSKSFGDDVWKQAEILAFCKKNRPWWLAWLETVGLEEFGNDPLRHSAETRRRFFEEKRASTTDGKPSSASKPSKTPNQVSTAASAIAQTSPKPAGSEQHRKRQRDQHDFSDETPSDAKILNFIKLEAREAVKPLDQMLRSLVRLPSQYEGKQLANVLQKHIKHIGSQVDSIAYRQAFSQEMLFKEIGAAAKRICRVEGVEPMALHDGDKLHAMYSKIKAKLAKRAAEAQLVAPESEGAATFADVQPHTAAARVSIKHGAAFRVGSETRGTAAGRISDGGCDSGGLANSNHQDSVQEMQPDLQVTVLRAKLEAERIACVSMDTAQRAQQDAARRGAAAVAQSHSVPSGLHEQDQMFDSESFLARFMAFRQYVEMLLKYATPKTAKTRPWKIEIHRDRLCQDMIQSFSGSSFSKVKLFQRTEVTMIDRFGIKEDGVDQGGLTAELYASFFREVLVAEVGLFEGADTYDDSSTSIGLLPKATAHPEALQAVVTPAIVQI